MNSISNKLISLSILFLFLPNIIRAESEISKLYTEISRTFISKSKIENVDSIKSCKQLARLEEINTMDLSLLNEAEKETLRNEIVGIQQARFDYEKVGGERFVHSDGAVYHPNHKGYYLSVSFGLLILLLLIILL